MKHALAFLAAALLAACASPVAPSSTDCPPGLTYWQYAEAGSDGRLVVNVHGCNRAEDLPRIQAACMTGRECPPAL